MKVMSRPYRHRHRQKTVWNPIRVGPWQELCEEAAAILVADLIPLRFDATRTAWEYDVSRRLFQVPSSTVHASLSDQYASQLQMILLLGNNRRSNRNTPPNRLVSSQGFCHCWALSQKTSEFRCVRIVRLKSAALSNPQEIVALWLLAIATT